MAYYTRIRNIASIPFIEKLLGAKVTFRTSLSDENRFFYGQSKAFDHAFIGWGLRPTTIKARQFALKNNLPFVALEDGFLRSFRSGQSVPPLSIVVDESGIYYDCHRPNDLESLINSDVDVLHGGTYCSADVVRARVFLVSNHLSKYNHAPDFDASVFDKPQWHERKRVLVIDQTAGDMSIVYGGADDARFAAMLAAARADFPDALIVVKTHPEVSGGAKRGYLTEVTEDERTCVLRDSVNPIQLLQAVDVVYVVTSTMGFEALLVGKPVVTFGVPWYAGWGCTDDRATLYQDFSNPKLTSDNPSVQRMQALLPAPTDWRTRRTRTRTVDELFAAAYFRYARYLNPVTHERGTIFDVMDSLVLQKNMVKRFSGRMIAVGFRRWKAANLRPMLSAFPDKVLFVKSTEHAQKLNPTSSDCLVHWGKKVPQNLTELACASGARLLCMEDGFVRSVGLGSDLIRPHSLVLDERGIYFDPTSPSDLEHILNHDVFDESDIRRAQAVRAFIVEHNISKYNIDVLQTPDWVAQSQGKVVVFVPGQVEDDASIQFGCTTVKTNLDLLKSARAAHPNGFIVYKPHPDVMAKNRIGALALDCARQFADVIEVRTSVVSCIHACDEVHTMTSLTGFDALLRGKKVVVYGRPFYSGWGLTEDKGEVFPAGRRVRALSLDELVAGALLHYPVYYDWDLKCYTTCEATLHHLLQRRSDLMSRGGLDKLRVGFVRRQLRKGVILAKAFWSEWRRQ